MSSVAQAIPEALDYDDAPDQAGEYLRLSLAMLGKHRIRRVAGGFVGQLVQLLAQLRIGAGHRSSLRRPPYAMGSSSVRVRACSAASAL